MKTPIELQKLFKEETGHPYLQVFYACKELEDDSDNEWNLLTIEEYVIWLQNKVIELLKR
jgi:hypothetical protein